MLRDARYLHQNLSGLKNVNSPTGMLETVINEKRVAAPTNAQNAPARSTTPLPPSSPATRTPPPPQTHHTPLESTNERLRGLFRRSTMNVSSETKEKVARPSTPPTPRAEKQVPKPAEKPPVREPDPEPPVSSPPPPPEKQALTTSPPPLSSPAPETNGRRSPLPVEKDLPIPVADSGPEIEVNEGQLAPSASITESQNSQNEAKPTEESIVPNGNGPHSEAPPGVSET